MRRFYFHIRRGQVTVLDHEGCELADAATAREEATRRVRAIVMRDGSDIGGGIIIADDNWQTLFELPFSSQEHPLNFCGLIRH